MLVKVKNDRKTVQKTETKAFHDGIVRMSGNARLYTMIQGLQFPSYRQRFFRTFGPDNWKQSAEEHVLFIDALLSGDREQAETSMREHVRRTGQFASKIVS